MWRSYLVVPCHTVWSKTTPSGVSAFNVLWIWIKTRQCSIGSIVYQCSSTGQSVQLVRSFSHHFTNYVHRVPRQGCKEACGIRVITHGKKSEGITNPSQETRNLKNNNNVYSKTITKWLLKGKQLWYVHQRKSCLVVFMPGWWHHTGMFMTAYRF